MPKVKTKKAAAKRFKMTGTGKLKRMKAYKSHILTKKTTKRKRNLRHAFALHNAEAKSASYSSPFFRRENPSLIALSSIEEIQRRRIGFLQPAIS